MKQRLLGNGLSVSEIGLGCMGMDHAYGKPASEGLAVINDTLAQIDVDETYF